LLSQLARFAIDRIILSALEKILSEDDVKAEIWMSLLEELDVEESRAAFGRGLQGDRCSLIHVFDILINDFAGCLRFVQEGGGQTSESWLIRVSERTKWVLAKPFFRRDEIFTLSVMRRMIDLAKLSYCEAQSDLDKVDQDLQKAPFYCLVTKLLIPSLRRSHLQEARHEAKLGLAQLALGLKIFKAEKGEYPHSLTELVPQILPKLPQDPFTGKDFVYKKEAEGFLVYSLGENCTDEGGKWDEQYRYQHDIPWRCKR